MNINYKINKIALLLVLIILNCKAEKKQEKHIDTINQGKVSILVNDLIAIKPEERIIIDYDDPSDNITNETCVQIYKLWDILRYKDEEYFSFDNSFEERNIVIENLENLLIDFLRTEESWFIDVKKEMPFLDNFSVSEDNMVRIYSWYYDLGTGDTSFSIIQYKAESGIINAVQVSSYDIDNQYRELGFYQGPSYGVGFKIEKYTYLIWGGARGGGNAATANFLTVRLLDGKIEPYKAFNGDNKLIFLFLIGQNGGNITSFNYQFNKKPFWIRIIYNVHEDPKNYSQWIIDHPSFEKWASPYIYDFLEFTFNGIEFIGDYTKFYEIENFTVYGN